MELISYRGNITGNNSSSIVENTFEAMENIVYNNGSKIAVDVILTNPSLDERTGKIDGILRLGHAIHNYYMGEALSNYHLMTQTFMMCHDQLTASYLVEEFTKATGKYYDYYYDIVLLNNNQMCYTARKRTLVSRDWQGDMGNIVYYMPYSKPIEWATTNHCNIITSYIR